MSEPLLQGKTTKEYSLTSKLVTWRKWTDIPLLIIAIGSLPLLLLEIISHRLTSGDKTFLLVVNVTVFLAYAVDYVIEFLVTPEKGRYVRSEWSSLLIVVAQLFAILPAMSFLGFLRGARALRVVSSLTRVIGISMASRSQGRQILKKRATSFAFGLAGFTLITSAVGFTLAEDVGKDGRVESFFDALWWSGATITTVGYGDIYPITAAGRIIAIFTMLVGISTLAVVTARIAQFLIKNDE
jgi:voltage-gated potassium channel